MAPRARRLVRWLAGSHRSWKRAGTAVTLLLGTLLAAVGSMHVADVRADALAASADERAAIVTTRLQTALNHAVDVLEAVRPLWALEEDPTRQQFADLLATGVADPTGDGPQTFDGLATVAFVRALDAGEADAFLARRRAELPESFSSELDGDGPHWVIDYFSTPETTILGTDLHPLPDRRAPMAQARDEGRAVATSWYHDVADRDLPPEDRRYITVVFVPVYEDGVDPGTVRARRERLVGWLASPLSANALAGGLGSGLDIGLELETPDGTVIATVGDTSAGTVRTRSVDLLGRSWQVEVVVPPNRLTEPALALVSPLAILLAGMCITLLVTALLRSQYLANDRAEERAERATRELRRSEESLRVITEQVPVGLLDLGADGRVQWANSALKQLIGMPPEADAVTTQHILFERLDPDDATDFRAALRAAAVSHLRQRFVDEHGSTRWAETTARPVLDDDGTPRRWLVSVVDVTPMVLTKDQLRQARDAAVESSRVKSAFLANMSHEIRTPLNGVIGMATLLLETRLDPEQREQLLTLRASAEELLALLGDILDLSRIEAGQLSIEDVAFSPLALAEGVVAQHASAAFAKGLELRLDATGALPHAVVGDPHRVRQVLHNLVGNAVKFTARGHVTVDLDAEVRDGQAHLVLAVSDTGPGIAPEAQGRVFDAFTQADSSTTRQFGGTGLGLSICRQLADLMGGELTLESVLAVGSRFALRLTLPVTDQQLPEPETPWTSTSTAPMAAADLRVLLVEDNVVNQQVALGLLATLGVEADVVSDGEAALEATDQVDYDLVLMDCQMPRMDGLEATRRMRRRGDTVRIVAMTASAMTGDRERCLEAGMDDYVAKPIRLEQLDAALRRCGATVRTPEPAAPPASAETIDPRTVASLRAVDGLFEGLCERYPESTRDSLRELRSGVRARDWEAASATAHRMRGSALAVGARRLAEVLGELEEGFERQPLASAGRLDEVAVLADSSIAALRRLAAEPSAVSAPASAGGADG